ncbi:NADH-quinone oxidoreductase subunit M [Brachybacterium sp. GPGPB12]|uniref:complex I subunit 4 family protein n=1 Tax=Brachybacterium sp. GPGPB12 TaxID=3023517 RepID=UPI0031345B90
MLGFIGLYVAAAPHTFDIPELVAATPLDDSPLTGELVLAAIVVGLAVKTPTVPFHTWLPPAHTDAPATGSAVLAAVLLKMGTYGFVRIAMPMLPEAWRSWAWAIVAIGIVSVLYGAFVALAQTDLKRMVAYTSVNHMGYIVLALGAAGLVAEGAEQARSVAVTGAVVQMVSHGLITAALFLLAGVMQDRAGTYDMGSYGGLAGPAPRYAALFAVGAFASLGLPGFSGFIAEFQIFAGGIAVAPVTAIALPGILVTAALFLRAPQQVFTGPTEGRSPGFADLRVRELWSVGPLLALSVLIGVFASSSARGDRAGLRGPGLLGREVAGGGLDADAARPAAAGDPRLRRRSGGAAGRLVPAPSAAVDRPRRGRGRPARCHGRRGRGDGRPRTERVLGHLRCGRRHRSRPDNRGPDDPVGPRGGLRGTRWLAARVRHLRARCSSPPPG